MSDQQIKYVGRTMKLFFCKKRRDYFILLLLTSKEKAFCTFYTSVCNDTIVYLIFLTSEEMIHEEQYMVVKAVGIPWNSFYLVTVFKQKIIIPEYNVTQVTWTELLPSPSILLQNPDWAVKGSEPFSIYLDTLSDIP